MEVEFPCRTHTKHVLALRHHGSRVRQVIYEKSVDASSHLRSGSEALQGHGAQALTSHARRTLDSALPLVLSHFMYTARMLVYHDATTDPLILRRTDPDTK